MRLEYENNWRENETDERREERLERVRLGDGIGERMRQMVEGRRG